ncbi:IS6 family transposase [Holosporaceae bacterium 'Namur']|nr:IS6 family transposase [Holosporaceae bacterium 'Namur']
MKKYQPIDFKWRHYEGEIILLCVRWYLRYRVSYRNLSEMMEERGLNICPSTIYRWVQHYGPEIQKKVSYFIKSTNASWYLDETYIKVKGKWLYLYRAIDSNKNTIDFYLSKTRNHKAAKLFLTKLLNKENTYEPKSITVDTNPSYSLAFTQLQKEGKFANTTIRKNKYLNNIIEQDHRRVKWKTKDAMGYHSYKTAYNTIRGIETINMLFKGQLYHLHKCSAINIKYFIERQFNLPTPAYIF